MKMVDLSLNENVSNVKTDYCLKPDIITDIMEEVQ